MKATRLSVKRLWRAREMERGITRLVNVEVSNRVSVLRRISGCKNHLAHLICFGRVQSVLFVILHWKHSMKQKILSFRLVVLAICHKSMFRIFGMNFFFRKSFRPCVCRYIFLQQANATTVRQPYQSLIVSTRFSGQLLMFAWVWPIGVARWAK